MSVGTSLTPFADTNGSVPAPANASDHKGSFVAPASQPARIPTIRPVSRASARARRGEVVRQWILLIPLATAVLGSMATQLSEDYLEMMPALFFIGALLITVAMLHQRQLFRQNETLSDELRGANEHLDLLHRLQFDLNQSLDVGEVSRTVLTHALSTFSADKGALWLRPHDVAVRPAEPRNIENRNVEKRNAGRRDWQLVASQGWPENQRDTLMHCVEQALEREDFDKGPHGDSGAVLSEGLLSHWFSDCSDADSSAMGLSILWKDEVIGFILIARQDAHSDRKNPDNEPFYEEDVELLREFALVTGPSLENALLYKRTLTRADIDGLTGLLNHRAVQERLVQELARTQRARRTNPDARFSIVVFDLADFKLFNDTYGHAIGDEILRTVARTLRATSRVSDVVARYGGDEFLAILVEAGEEGAMTICNRTIETLRAQPFIAEDGSQIVIRITCGIAVYPADGEDGHSLFEAADARLYEAKQQGRQVIPYVRVAPDEREREKASLWGHFGVLDALITAIDNRDHYTRRHSEQVMAYALLLAREMNGDRDILEAVRIGGLLYDIGKIAVPDAILRKPGLLSPDEMRLMQQHCRFGAMMVQDVAHRERVLECVQHHHEAWDGSGYPGGLRSEEIPWMGRLIAVADAFAAMTTDRPYRKALAPVAALGELQRARGTRFDPTMVDAFGDVLKDVIAERKTLPLLVAEAHALGETLSRV
ncbi:MAG TPA: diguanylate cyclase [Abditibacteriaceae bacterium]